MPDELDAVLRGLILKFNLAQEGQRELFTEIATLAPNAGVDFGDLHCKPAYLTGEDGPHPSDMHRKIGGAFPPVVLKS